MKIEYKVSQKTGFVGPATVIFVPTAPGDSQADAKLEPYGGLISPLIESGAFQVGKSEVFVLSAGMGEWLLVVGLAQLTKAGLLESTALASKKLKDLGVEKATFIVPKLPLDLLSVVEWITLGLTLALEPRQVYKSKSEEKPLRLKEVYILDNDQGIGRENAQWAIHYASLAGKAQLQARSFIDRPANLLYPEIMAYQASKIGQDHGVSVTVWDEKKLAEEGAGGVLAVGGGSLHPPRMVIVEYQGQGANENLGPIALVGKGVTFDSGGFCLKPPENMSLMKTDMAGAATVFFTIIAAADLKIPVHLVGVLPLAENLPDGGAFRPGDIITTLSGQTIEIVNTDAEGRVILADALTLAQRYKPSRIIDLATLTGACLVGLGESMAGFFCNDLSLNDDLTKAFRAAAEDFWPLPLYEGYDEKLKSDLADFKESGSRAGGAIVGALFLRRFIEANLPWAHLDIVGAARNTTAKPHCPEGATGYGVRTLLRFLLDSVSPIATL
ncbi:MAG: leucyl aminopeptidase [Deltaproteobacteria bacterium]|jgi:leucyl aminopeptidase|nr:leucyl aminopeptidase [Deltaproteobacteria bacterium]